MPMNMLWAWLTLSFLPGLGCTRIHRLVDIFGSPAAVLAASPQALRQVEGIGAKMSRVLADRAAVETAGRQAELELRRLAALDLVLLCPDDPRYPELLRAIADPPVLLYCQGDPLCLARPAVAMVGSRAATAYGKRVSFELARELAVRGVCVVSGMALGIDGQAHAGALAGGGATIGVLGCGADVVYPPQHADLFREVAGQGLLLSEYPLGARPEGFRFPERNRIISGLCLGVVVVEASLKSGSLITAGLALEQGREVFAVPGRVDSAKSQGAHRLLQQGAKLVHTVEDILEEFSQAGIFAQASRPERSIAPSVPMTAAEQQLWDCLDVYPLTVDQLVRQSGFAPARVLSLLLDLELKGLVRQLPGQEYERRLRDSR
ncbi:MAG: DNA-processing protein DprA [Desulfobulbaceae bacterium]